jgi:hypothetical protein
MSKRVRVNPATASLRQLFDGSRHSPLELDSTDFFDQVMGLVESGADVNVNIEGVEENEDEHGVNEEVYSTTPFAILLEAYYDLFRSDHPRDKVEELIHYFFSKEVVIKDVNLWTPTVYNDARMLEELLKHADFQNQEKMVFLIFSEQIGEVFAGFGFETKMFDEEDYM